MIPFSMKIEQYSDERGVNSILFDAKAAERIGNGFRIVQINQGFSEKAFTLRGLHYQEAPHSQAKLCFCLTGSVFNVGVNLKTGEVFSAVLDSKTAMFIPKGYAHGYLTLEPNTLFQWCVDNDFAPESSRVIHYSCVDWPIEDWSRVVISEKDRNADK